MDLRQNEFNPKTNRTILERSGSLQKRAVDYHHRESTNLRKKVSRRDRTIEHLMKQTSMKCEVNQWSDLVFNEDTLAKAKESLYKEGLSRDSIAAYAFEQSLHRGRQLRRYCQMLEWSRGHLKGVEAIPEQRHLRLQQMTFLQKFREIILL